MSTFYITYRNKIIVQYKWLEETYVCFMVFKATYNNISVISWHEQMLTV